VIAKPSADLIRFPQLGAFPHANGTTKFRVWALHAKTVAVAVTTL
jgi:hypothetical protein